MKENDHSSSVLQKPVMVDRIERDVQKLTEFYEEGYDCARNLFEF